MIPKRKTPMNTDKIKEEKKEIEIVERIVIDFANLSGRESKNRAEFRKRVLNHILSYRSIVLEEVKKEIDLLSKHYAEKVC